MIDLSTWKKAWALLETRERRNAWIVLAIIIAGGLSSALMVGSVLALFVRSGTATQYRDHTGPELGLQYVRLHLRLYLSRCFGADLVGGDCHCERDPACENLGCGAVCDDAHTFAE